MKLLRSPLVLALGVVLAAELLATAAGSERTMATTVRDGVMVLVGADVGKPVSDKLSRTIYGGDCPQYGREGCEAPGSSNCNENAGQSPKPYQVECGCLCFGHPYGSICGTPMPCCATGVITSCTPGKPNLSILCTYSN